MLVMINVDSRSQLRRLAEIAPEGLRISFRVNPLLGQVTMSTASQGRDEQDSVSWRGSG